MFTNTCTKWKTSSLTSVVQDLVTGTLPDSPGLKLEHRHDLLGCGSHVGSVTIGLIKDFWLVLAVEVGHQTRKLKLTVAGTQRPDLALLELFKLGVACSTLEMVLDDVSGDFLAS